MKEINCSETVVTALRLLENVIGVIFGSSELKCFTAKVRPKMEPWIFQELPVPVTVYFDAKFLNAAGVLHTITPGLINVRMEIPMFSSDETGIRVVPCKYTGLQEIRVINSSHAGCSPEVRNVKFDESGIIRVMPEEFSNRLPVCFAGYSAFNHWTEPYKQ